MASPLKENSEKKRLMTILDDIVSNSTVGILTINDKQEILFFNAEAEYLFGYSADEVHGKKMTMLIPEYARAGHQGNINGFRDSPCETLLQRDVNREFSLQGLHKNGHVFFAAVGISRTHLKDGSWTFTAFIRDSTKERIAEKNSKEARVKAEKANKIKSEFLANMSHELRTPMHGILSYSQLGIKRIESATNDKLKRYFTNIETSGIRLLGLLNNLLDLAKLESGKLKLTLGEYSIEKIINDCIVEVAAKCDETQLKIFIDKPESDLLIFCDELRIKQVIINLLSNAIKFSPVSGEIKIKYFIDNSNYFLLKISDQGPGIPSDKTERIFEKFIQEDGKVTGTGMGSTGLGLAISKEIILIHNGNIWVDDNKNQKIGSTICFSIPMVGVDENEY